MDPFNLLLGFTGRVDRKHYWLGLGLAWIGGLAIAAACVAVFFFVLAFSNKEPNVGYAVYGAFGFLALLALASLAAHVSTMALAAKRLHDLGHSGFWCLPLLIAPSPMGAYAAFGFLVLTEFSTALYAPGNWYLLSTVAGAMGVVVLGCLTGKPGPNRFGDAPDGAPHITPTEPQPASAAPFSASGPVATHIIAAKSSFGRKPSPLTD